MTEQRFRITVRGDGVELRGYIDGWDTVRKFAAAIEGTELMVVASPAPQDYAPFAADDLVPEQ